MPSDTPRPTTNKAVLKAMAVKLLDVYEDVECNCHDGAAGSCFYHGTPDEQADYLADFAATFGNVEESPDTAALASLRTAVRDAADRLDSANALREAYCDVQQEIAALRALVDEP